MQISEQHILGNISTEIIEYAFVWYYWDASSDPPYPQLQSFPQLGETDILDYHMEV